MNHISTFIAGGVPFLEARPLLQADGLTIKWFASNKTVQADRTGLRVVLTLNSTKAIINNKNTTLESGQVLVSFI